MSMQAPAARGFWRGVLADASTFGAGQLAPARALPAAAAISVAMVPGLLAGDLAAAATMGAGALLTGVASLLVGPRPARTMVAVAAAMAAATFAGSASGAIPALHLVILIPVAFSAGLAGGISREASIVALQSAMAMIVFGRFAEPPVHALEFAGFVALGGAVQVVLAVVTSAAGGVVQQRRLVADAYSALAGQAAASVSPPVSSGPSNPGAPPPVASPGASPKESGKALDDAAAFLSSPAFLGAEAARSLRSLVDEGERIRVEIAAIANLTGQLQRHGDDVAAARLNGELELAASQLASLALGLRRGRRRAERLDGAAGVLPGTTASPGAGEAETNGVEPLDAALARAASLHVAALAGQLRAATRLLDEANSSGASGVGLLPALVRMARRRSPGQGALAGARADRASEVRAEVRLLLDPDSSQFRHAVRLAIVLPVCELIADLAPLQRGYWIALTAGVVLRPDFGGTVTRGVARVIGTLLGVGLATLLLRLHPEHATETVLVGVLAWGAFTVFQANYALFSAVLTALVVILLGLVTTDSSAIALDRLLATLIGGAVALIAYCLWPTWSAGDARGQLSRLVAAQREYAKVVFALLLSPAAPEGAALDEAARRARRARTSAEDAVTRALGDPKAYRIDRAVTSGVLSAMRRFIFAVHALRSDVEGGVVQRPVPDVAPFAAAVGDTLEALGSALETPGEGRANGRNGTASSAGATPAGDSDRALQLPPLRSLHGDLVAKLSGLPGSLPVIASTDEMVDALDSAAAALAPTGGP